MKWNRMYIICVQMQIFFFDIRRAAGRGSPGHMYSTCIMDTRDGNVIMNRTELVSYIFTSFPLSFSRADLKPASSRG